MNTTLSLIRQEFELKINELDNIVERALEIPDIPNKIKVIIGMRRTGKTYFLFQKIRELWKNNVSMERILYLNLEDDRLQPLTTKRFSDLVDDFYTLYPENHHRKCYLFFDEIQNVEGWARVIRRLFDSKNVDIYLTGSSAKLLSKEIASALRGRSIAYEMWPYSFKEYLSAHGKSFLQPKTRIDNDVLMNDLNNYLLQGGFPEISVLSSFEQQKTLQEYVDVVIFRDIVERHHITNLTLVKYMIKYLMKNAATSMTLNKFYNDLKSQGYSIGRSTVYEYLDHIQDAYLAFHIPLYSESVRKMQVNPRKIYTIDSGLSNAYRLSFSKNFGHLFENLFYLDLRRRGDEIYYYLTKDRYEVDFLTRSLDGKLHLYQVVWDTENANTLEREKRALEAAEQELQVPGVLITPATYLQYGY